MPPAIAKIGTCKLRFCERLNLNFNIATCAGGLLSMGVRLRKNSRWLNASPIVPEPGRVISSGRASKKCRRKPRRGDRLPGGCWRKAASPEPTVRGWMAVSFSRQKARIASMASAGVPVSRWTLTRPPLVREQFESTPTRARCKVCGKGRVRQNSAANGRHGARRWALDDPPVRTA